MTRSNDFGVVEGLGIMRALYLDHKDNRYGGNGRKLFAYVPWQSQACSPAEPGHTPVSSAERRLCQPSFRLPWVYVQ